MIFILGLGLIWLGAANTTPGVWNAAPFLTLAGIGIAVYGLTNLIEAWANEGVEQ